MKSILGHIFPNWYRKCLLKKYDISQSLKDYLLQEPISKDTLIKDIEFVVIDFETTGLDITNDKIVSIGYTIIKDLKLFVKLSEHIIVNPKQSLDEENVSIHHLTDDEVIEGISITKAMDSIFVVIKGRVLIAHFDKIERGFINQACKKLYGFNRLPMLMLDTLEIEKKKVMKTTGFIKLGSLRLFTLREQYNLPRYKAHNAMQDAISTAELFLAQVAYMDNLENIKLGDLI